MIRYICSNCGFVLYELKSVERNFTGVVEPRYIVKVYNGVCPRCGKSLEPPTTENWRERIRVELKLRKLLKT